MVNLSRGAVRWLINHVAYPERHRLRGLLRRVMLVAPITEIFGTNLYYEGKKLLPKNC